jgi:hypothetical protein
MTDCCASATTSGHSPATAGMPATGWPGLVELVGLDQALEEVDEQLEFIRPERADG